MTRTFLRPDDVRDLVRDRHVGPCHGRLADADRGTSPARPAEDVVLDRALGDLAGASDRDSRAAAKPDRIAAHLRRLRDRVRPRQAYAPRPDPRLRLGAPGLSPAGRGRRQWDV